MTSTVLRLAVIALLVYAGVSLWYSRVEEELQGQQPLEQKERVPTPVQEERQPVVVVAENDYRIINQKYFQGGS